MYAHAQFYLRRHLQSTSNQSELAWILVSIVVYCACADGGQAVTLLAIFKAYQRYFGLALNIYYNLNTGGKFNDVVDCVPIFRGITLIRLVENFYGTIYYFLITWLSN